MLKPNLATHSSDSILRPLCWRGSTPFNLVRQRSGKFENRYPFIVLPFIFKLGRMDKKEKKRRAGLGSLASSGAGLFVRRMEVGEEGPMASCWQQWQFNRENIRSDQSDERNLPTTTVFTYDSAHVG